MALLLPVALVVAGYFPLVLFAPIGIDSGVFIYAGQELSRGNLAYVDFWDHKGPLLYTLNMLGTDLAGIRGVVALEGLILAVAIGAGGAFWLTTRRSWTVPLFMTLFVLAYFEVFEGGNLSETWAVGPALVAYSAFGAALLCLSRSRISRWRLATAIATCAGAAAAGFLLRPNNGVGVWVALAALVIVAFRPDAPHRTKGLALSLALAAVMVPTLFAAYAVRSRASLADMVDQLFTFNRVNVESGGADRWTAGLRLLEVLITTPLGIATLGATLVVLGLWWGNRRMLGAFGVLGVCVILDLGTSFVSGRGYLHYLVSVLPSLAALGTLGFILITDRVRAGPVSWTLKARYLAVPAIALLAISVTVSARGTMRGLQNLATTGLFADDSALGRSVQISRGLAGSPPSALQYGGQARLLSAAEIPSVSRIIYLYPLLSSGVPGYRNKQALRDELTNDVLIERPNLIIRAPDTCPFAEDAMSCQISSDARDLPRLRAWIKRNYTLAHVEDGVEYWQIKG